MNAAGCFDCSAHTRCKGQPLLVDVAAGRYTGLLQLVLAAVGCERRQPRGCKQYDCDNAPVVKPPLVHGVCCLPKLRTHVHICEETPSIS